VLSIPGGAGKNDGIHVSNQIVVCKSSYADGVKMYAGVKARCRAHALLVLSGLLVLPALAYAQPDLVMSTVSTPTTLVGVGTTLTVTNTVTNQGTVAAGLFSVRLYLSSDATITTADIVLGTRNVSSLAAGAMSSADTVVTIPGTTTPGNYYIGAIADYTNTIAESNEANNELAASGTLSVAQSDLVVTAVGSMPTVPVGVGTSFLLPNTVTNQGPVTTPGFSVRAYLSTDATITTSDVQIGTRFVSGGLAAGVASAADIGVAIPGSTIPGTYYIGVVADTTNAVAESNETNNVLAASGTLSVGRSDLTPVDLGVPNTNVIPESVLPITAIVSNLGSFLSPSFPVGFYLSTDSTITTSDTFLGSTTVAALAGGISVAVTKDIYSTYLPLGSHYIGVIVDYANQVTESNETNNVLAMSVPIVIGRPDLVPTAVTSASPSFPVGGVGSVIVDLMNQGTISSIGASSVAVYLSADNVITTADTLVGTGGIAPLAVGATTAAAVTITVPAGLTTGVYYVGAIADSLNQQAESNESNNALAGSTMTVTSAPAITTLSPSTGPVGASVTIAGANFGAAQGASRVTFNGVPAIPTSWSATSIAVPVPIGSSTGPVVVTVAGVASNPVTFTGVTGVSGTVTQASSGAPVSGAVVALLQGATVIGSATTNSSGAYALTGFGAGTYALRVSAVGYHTAMHSQVNVISGGATTVNVALQQPSAGTAILYTYDELGRLKTVVGPSGESATYHYDAVGNLLSIARNNAMSIVEFAPNSGPAGTAVTIVGTGFSATASQNAVTFNGLAASVTSASATQLVVAVPVGATTGLLSVTTPTGSATTEMPFLMLP
jgi:YD repeat-containing protein